MEFFKGFFQFFFINVRILIFAIFEEFLFKVHFCNFCGIFLQNRPAPSVLAHLRFAQMRWRLFEPPRGHIVAASIAQSAIELRTQCAVDRPAPKVLAMRWRLFEPPRGHFVAASIALCAIELRTQCAVAVANFHSFSAGFIEIFFSCNFYSLLDEIVEIFFSCNFHSLLE